MTTTRSVSFNLTVDAFLILPFLIVSWNLLVFSLVFIRIYWSTMRMLVSYTLRRRRFLRTEFAKSVRPDQRDDRILGRRLSHAIQEIDPPSRPPPLDLEPHPSFERAVALVMSDLKQDGFQVCSLSLPVGEILLTELRHNRDRQPHKLIFGRPGTSSPNSTTPFALSATMRRRASKRRSASPP